jgi:steroid delta-isomerase-like uncharacterized protein
MSEEANLAVIRRQFEAWNDHDWSALTRDVSDGFLMDSDTNTSPVVGKDGLRAYARTMNVAFPDLHFDVIDLFGGGEMVAATWLASATHRGDFRGMSPTGRRIELHGCTITRFREGRIARQHFFWDMHTLRRQLGAPSIRPPITYERELSLGEAGRDA